jgi:hypothetical protein
MWPPSPFPCSDPILSRLPLEVLVRELLRRAGQPAVDDRLAERRPGDLPQLDEDGRVAVEVRDVKARGFARARPPFAEILDTDGKDGPVGRGLVADRLRSALLTAAPANPLCHYHVRLP